MYEVCPATHRAHASSLIVAAAYVRFIRSTERMTTPCMKLSARQEQVGNSGPNGMDEPPFPPAGEPIPDEAEAVARDAVRPQDQLRGERHPPQQFSSRGCGQLTQRDQPSTSQELNRGRSADAVAENSSSHESRWDPTPSRLRPQPPLPGPRAKVSTAAATTAVPTHCIVATSALTLSSA